MHGALEAVFRHLIFNRLFFGRLFPVSIRDSITVKFLNYPVCYGDYLSFDEADCTTYSYTESVDTKIAQCEKVRLEAQNMKLKSRKEATVSAFGACFARRGRPVSVLDVGGGTAGTTSCARVFAEKRRSQSGLY